MQRLLYPSKQRCSKWIRVHGPIEREGWSNCCQAFQALGYKQHFYFYFSKGP